MPIYEYECRRCSHQFEIIQKFSDKPRKRCPECRGAVDRLISKSGFRLKGTGWYVTDYADKKKGPDKGETGSNGGDKKSDSKKSDSPKTDSKKTESKKEQKAS